MTLYRSILALLGFNLLLTLAGGLFNYSLYSDLHARGAIADLAGAPPVGNGSSDFHTIEKIIFNLQEQGREHYFVLDLVLQTDNAANLAQIKRFEPMVRHSVVNHLSQMSFPQLRALPLLELQQRLEQALLDDFAGKHLSVPFSAVLVSKLIVQ